MSEHYGTLPDALTYHNARGNAAWGQASVTDALRTAALVRASEALDGQYGPRYSGGKATRAQALQWPRIGARDACVGEDLPQDEVPVGVERAAYALALVELTAPGALSPSYTPGAVMKREKVGEVERERFGASEGGQFGLEAMRPQIATAENAIRCLLTPKGATVWLLRV